MIFKNQAKTKQRGLRPVCDRFRRISLLVLKIDGTNES